MTVFKGNFPQEGAHVHVSPLLTHYTLRFSDWQETKFQIASCQKLTADLVHYARAFFSQLLLMQGGPIDKRVKNLQLVTSWTRIKYSEICKVQWTDKWLLGEVSIFIDFCLPWNVCIWYSFSCHSMLECRAAVKGPTFAWRLPLLPFLLQGWRQTDSRQFNRLFLTANFTEQVHVNRQYNTGSFIYLCYTNLRS